MRWIDNSSYPYKSLFFSMNQSPTNAIASFTSFVIMGASFLNIKFYKGTIK